MQKYWIHYATTTKERGEKKQKTDKLKIKRTELDEQLAVAFALIRRQCENTCYIVIFS